MRSRTIRTVPAVFLVLLLPSCDEGTSSSVTRPENPPVEELIDNSERVKSTLDTVFESGSREVKKITQQYESDTLYREWNYSSGQLNGESYSYHPDGKPFSMHTYVNGKKNGPYRTWHSNGQLYIEGQWKDDVPVGMWRFYAEDGRLMQERDSDKDPIIVDPDTLKK